MSRAFFAGKRNREASRDLKKKQKEERLRRNRELRAQGLDPDLEDPEIDAVAEPLPEVAAEDVVISVPSQPRRSDMGPSKLFVGGLSARTTTEELRAFFAPFGELIDAAVVINRSTGQSRGFGFVTFRSSADAAKAIADGDGRELDGSTIRVNRAEARPGR